MPALDATPRGRSDLTSNSLRQGDGLGSHARDGGR